MDPIDEMARAGRDARDDQLGIGVDRLQRLWAPWRFGYLAGDDPPFEGCPFCVLPDRGPDRDRESLILHRGEHTYVIFNAYPYNPGHLMVCPYAHVGGLADLDGGAADEVWSLGRRAVTVLEERVECQGVNLGMNLGVAGGAGITEHLHLHVVPRWVGDTNFMSVVGASRVLPRELASLAAPLLAAAEPHRKPRRIVAMASRSRTSCARSRITASASKIAQMVPAPKSGGCDPSFGASAASRKFCGLYVMRFAFRQSPCTYGSRKPWCVPYGQPSASSS